MIDDRRIESALSGDTVAGRGDCAKRDSIQLIKVERVTAPPLKCIIRNISQTLFYHVLFQIRQYAFS